MIILDTCVLIALFDPDHVHHQQAEAMFTSRVDDAAAISVLTAAEFLVYPFTQGTADSALSHLGAIGVAILPLKPEEAIQLAAIRARSRLKMPDAVVLHLALANGAAVMTFDKALARAARDAGLEVIDWDGGEAHQSAHLAMCDIENEPCG